MHLLKDFRNSLLYTISETGAPLSVRGSETGRELFPLRLRRGGAKRRGGQGLIFLPCLGREPRVAEGPLRFRQTLDRDDLLSGRILLHDQAVCRGGAAPPDD